VAYGITNTPATFEPFIDDWLPPDRDGFALCDLEDIISYVTNKKEYKELIWMVLERQGEFSFHCKAKTVKLESQEVAYLGFLSTLDRISMKSDKMATIGDWPTQKSIWDVQVLLGYGNISWRLIRKYSKVMLPITELLMITDIVHTLNTTGMAPWKPIKPQLVLPTVLNWLWGCGSGLESNWNLCNRFHPNKQPNSTKLAVVEVVLHFRNLRYLVLLKYLSCDCITILYICKMCHFR